MFKRLFTGLVILTGFAIQASAHFKTTPNSPVHITDDGKLVYKANEKGDSGCSKNGTTLLGTGGDRATVLRIAGINNKKSEGTISLANKYFPVNTTNLTFQDSHNFKVGDEVVVNRPSTKEWLEKLGADKIGLWVDYTLTTWTPGDFDLNFYRKVIAVTPESITLDVPLTNSIDPQYGGGSVAKYNWPGRITHTGVENIRFDSSYDSANEKDENHRWMAITFDNVTDAWVRRITAEHFVSSAVAVWETASRITVEDCKSLLPVGETGNYRRYSFQTLGQQVLFQRCYAEYGYHAFSVGFTTPGPNAFVQCLSYAPINFSGAIGGWANGILFDKMTIDGGTISLAYLDVDGQGGGWSAANSLCWQCRAAQIHLPAPPTAQNWAYASWAQGYGDGHHELPHTFVKPESFFYAQLEARTGKPSKETDKILIYKSSETTAPAFEAAAEMSRRSKMPDVTMFQWIDSMIIKYPIKQDLSGAKKLEDTGFTVVKKSIPKAAPVVLKNGWLVRDGSVITGRRDRTSLWKGSTRPSDLSRPAANLVRFVPGRIGRGLTDELDTLATDMIKGRVAVMQNFPALWYERRRDDHARTRRADAGDKRVFMAVEFYDTTNVVLKKLHRNYIRKSLDNFKENSNIIHHLGMEYTGPVHFVKFWLDVIGQWERENKKHVLVMLPGTKDVQDAILNDPKRSGLVDIVDVVQWQYRADGSLYAPIGGVSLAERQYSRLEEVGETSFDQIYRAVHEFHLKYPGKAIAYNRRGTKFADWAVLMGGGSLASIPQIKEARFLRDAAEMSSLTMKDLENKVYALGKAGTGYILFSESKNLSIDLDNDHNNYNLHWINPATGEIQSAEIRVTGSLITTITAQFEGPVVAWLTK